MAKTRRDIEALDARFEQALEQALFEVTESDLTPEKRRARRKNADRSDLAFCKIYFPKIFTEDFNLVHRHVAALTQGNFTVSGFPGSGKSAFTFVGKAIKHIAAGKGGIVAVAARTQDKAEARTSHLSRIILANRTLCYDYGIECIQDRSGYHIFKSDGGHTHLVAGSVNTGLRSIVDDDFKRITLAVGDDLYDKETVRSETDNTRVTEWIKGELWRQMERDGLSVVLGNAINDDCPIVRLKRERPEQHFSFPIRDDKGRSQWPARYPDDVIEEMEAEIPFDVWQGEYLDDPAEKGDVFDPSHIRHVRINLLEVVAAITAIDPAHGESPEACYKSAMTLGMLTNGQAAVLDAYLRKEGYTAFFNYLHAVRQRVPAHKAFLFENDFSQFAFAQPYYLQWMKDTGEVLPIVLHNSKDSKTEFRAADKDSRIMNLVHPHQTGQLVYHDELEGSPDFKLFRKQLLAFGRSKAKLDGPDALATAYIMVRAYIETGAFRPLAERRFHPPRFGGSFR